MARAVDFSTKFYHEPGRCARSESTVCAGESLHVASMAVTAGAAVYVSVNAAFMLNLTLGS